MMITARRTFFRALLTMLGLVTNPFRSAALDRLARDSRQSARVVHARLLSASILPGGCSTVMLVGSNLQAVTSVKFSDRLWSASIVECDATYLLLRVVVSPEAPTASSRLWLLAANASPTLVAGVLQADPSRQGGASYSGYPVAAQSYGRPAYGYRTSQALRDNLDGQAYIGAHLL